MFFGRMRLWVGLVFSLAGPAVFGQCLDHVAIGSWNTKHLGRANFSYAAASALLANFDLVALQEINTTPSGVQALQELQQALRDLTKENWCSIVSGVPTDARERYAFLWRDRSIALVERSHLQTVRSCPQAAEEAFLLATYAHKIVREPAGAYFYAKDDQRLIFLASVHLVPTAKKPQLEVPWLWQTLHAEVQSLAASPKDRSPVWLVAGDFNLASSDPSFKIWQQHQWRPALPGTAKTSLRQKQKALHQAYDNVWWWDQTAACQMSYQVVNPYEVFPRMPAAQIYREISDHAPIGIYYQAPVTPRAAPAWP